MPICQEVRLINPSFSSPPSLVEDEARRGLSVAEAQIRVPRHVQIALRNGFVVPFPGRHSFRHQSRQCLGHLRM